MSTLQVGQINDAAGNTALTLSSGNTTLGGTLTTGGNIDASSHGIYLGANAASNLLDDYEEGTWTPTLSTGTPSVVSGIYIKIGTLVVLKGRVNYTITDTSTAYLRLGGLPFAVASDADNRGYQVCYVNGLTGTAAWETYDGSGSLAFSYQGTTFLGNRTTFSGKYIDFTYIYPVDAL